MGMSAQKGSSRPGTIGRLLRLTCMVNPQAALFGRWEVRTVGVRASITYRTKPLAWLSKSV